MNTQILLIKTEIKKTVEVQKELKNQTRTIRLVGNRTMEPWQAQMRKNSNREKLRLMYAAYAIMRGKDLKTVEQHYDSSKPHFLNVYNSEIKSIIEKFSNNGKE